MKKYWLIIIALWVVGPVIGQFQVTIDAQLVDLVSQKPIEFANVRFLDTLEGKTTLLDGRENLSLIKPPKEAGKPNETKQVKSIKLYKFRDKVSLDSFTI